MESIDVQLKQAIQKAVMKAFDIELDWKNIVIENPISSLGYHEVLLELHKKVIAKLKIQLVK